MQRNEILQNVIPPLAFTIILFTVWQLVCTLFQLPLTILPAPSDVFAALWQYRVPIAENSWVTLWTTLVGFLLATAGGLFLFHHDSSTEIRWTTPKPDTASLSIA